MINGDDNYVAKFFRKKHPKQSKDFIHSANATKKLLFRI